MKPLQFLAISAFWFATNLHWGSLLTIVIPSQVARLSPAHQAEVLSLVVGLGAVVALVVQPLVGFWSDRCASRFGRRRPFVAAGSLVNLLGLGVMLAAFYQASLPAYIGGFLLVQLGNNLAMAAYAGFIPDLVPPSQRGTASGYMAAMTQLGTVTGALACGQLMGKHLDGAAFSVIMLVLAAMLAVTLIGVRETPLAERPAGMAWQDVLRGLWLDPREHPDFAWVWVTRALVTTGIWVVQPFLQYYLRDVLKVDSPEAVTGQFLAMMLVGATITGWLGGRWSDRVGRKRVVYVANGLLAVATLSLLASHSLAFTFAVGIVYGLGYGAYYSVDWALACDVLPDPAAAAKDLGVWNIAMVLPQAIAPAVSGTVLALIGKGAAPGSYTLPGYACLFVLAACFLTLGAFLLTRVRGAR